MQKFLIFFYQRATIKIIQILIDLANLKEIINESYYPTDILEHNIIQIHITLISSF